MNVAFISGIVDSDVTRTDFPKGGSVTRFRVKTFDTYTVDGEMRESSQVHLIDVYNDYLQNGIVKTLSKGQSVELQGSIQSRNIAQAGQPARWTTTIVLRGSGIINVVGSARSGMSVASSAEERPAAADPRIDHSPRKAAPASYPADGLDDDVPF
jgi:single-stranded DNA-binding protein